MCGLIGVNDAPFPSYLSKFFRNFKVNLSDFFSKLKTKLLKYFPEILGTFLRLFVVNIKDLLARKMDFSTRLQSALKIVLIVNFRSKCLEYAPFLSNAHFYQTFRKNFHQNFGVCGLLGSHWRTLPPLFLSKFRMSIKLFAKIFIKILECVAL